MFFMYHMLGMKRAHGLGGSSWAIFIGVAGVRQEGSGPASRCPVCCSCFLHLCLLSSGRKMEQEIVVCSPPLEALVSPAGTGQARPHLMLPFGPR